MMISSKESCGTDIPNTGGRHTMFSQGFYNPPYQISGQQYMAGTIAPAGVSPIEVGELAYAVFVSKMNLRETPSVDAAKAGSTDVNVVYNIKAKSWDTATTSANLKVGETQRLWYLLTPPEDANKLLGWACAIEAVKTGEPEIFDKIYYAIPDTSDDAAKLSDAQLKQYQKDKDAQIAKVKKWKAANAPKTPSGKNTPAAKTASEESGLSTTSMVLIGLGAAALVYFLIQQGKKGR